MMAAVNKPLLHALWDTLPVTNQDTGAMKNIICLRQSNRQQAFHAGKLRGHRLATILLCLFAGIVLQTVSVQAAELEDYPAVGPTPALVLKDLGGVTHTLDDYRGQVVLLNFWATWCPPCLIEMPAMQRLKTALADTPFAILAVNVKESREKAWRFQQLLEVDFTVLRDTTGQVGEDWNITVYPTSYLVDGTGHIRYMTYGAPDWDSKEVRQVIKALINESPP